MPQIPYNIIITLNLTQELYVWAIWLDSQGLCFVATWVPQGSILGTDFFMIDSCPYVKQTRGNHRTSIYQTPVNGRLRLSLAPSRTTSGRTITTNLPKLYSTTMENISWNNIGIMSMFVIGMQEYALLCIKCEQHAWGLQIPFMMGWWTTWLYRKLWMMMQPKAKFKVAHKGGSIRIKIWYPIDHVILVHNKCDLVHCLSILAGKMYYTGPMGKLTFCVIISTSNQELWK